MTHKPTSNEIEECRIMLQNSTKIKLSFQKSYDLIYRITIHKIFSNIIQTFIIPTVFSAIPNPIHMDRKAWSWHAERIRDLCMYPCRSIDLYKILIDEYARRSREVKSCMINLALLEKDSNIYLCTDLRKKIIGMLNFM